MHIRYVLKFCRFLFDFFIVLRYVTYLNFNTSKISTSVIILSFHSVLFTFVNYSKIDIEQLLKVMLLHIQLS